MPDPTTQAEALTAFLETFDDSMLALHVGPRLSCSEVAPLADLLAAHGHRRAARLWLECHAEGDDDPEDTHYQGANVPAETEDEDR